MRIRISTFTKLLKFSVVFFLFRTCSLFHDEGDWKIEIRNVDSFSRIDLFAVSDVYYHKSDSNFIQISYYSNHLSDVKTKVADNVLTIENKFNATNHNSYRLPRLDIYTPHFIELCIKEAGSFTCIDTLKMSYFTFRVVGDLVESKILACVQTLIVSIESSAGKVDIDGTAKILELYNRGETKIDAVKMDVNKIKVQQQSYLDVWVRTNGSLDYKILRSGNIYLSGNPTIEGELLGPGKLIRHE